MSENENTIDETLKPVEAEENLAGDGEELPIEEKLKAINLQDLIYIKKFIEKQVAKCYKKTDTVANATNAVNAENALNARDAEYAEQAAKAQCDADGNIINETYLTKTGTIDNAVNAKTAEEAGKAQCDADGNVIPDTYYKKTDTVALAEESENVRTNGIPSFQDPQTGAQYVYISKPGLYAITVNVQNDALYRYTLIMSIQDVKQSYKCENIYPSADGDMSYGVLYTGATQRITASPIASTIYEVRKLIEY